MLYARRNVGLVALSYLKGRGYNVSVISDDADVLWLAKDYGCEILYLNNNKEYDLFISVHGNQIIKKPYLVEGKMVNIHPCLFKYKGKDPISRYIQNKDVIATVESHYMIEKVDMGEVIHREKFETLDGVQSHAEFYNIALPFYIKCLSKTLELLNI